MATRHPEHEQLIEQVLSGELAEAPPELAGCIECRERLHRLQATTGRLDAAGAEQRAVMAEAAALRGVVGEDRVAALVWQHLPVRHGRRWPAILMAMAAMLLLLGVLFWARGDGRPADRLMNDAGYRPIGRDVQDLAEKGFAWPGRAGASYVVELYIAGDEFPWDTIRCNDDTWVPDADYVRRMRNDGPDWYWQVGTLGEPDESGLPKIARSDRFSFSFSR